MNIRFAKYAAECGTNINLKCKDCPKKETGECDFPWLYYEAGSAKFVDFLGIISPVAMKISIKNNRMIVVGDNEGFCEFTLSSKPTPHITVSHIAVMPEARGKGYAKAMLDYLCQLNPGVDIIATCKEHWDSNKFWSSVAELEYKKQSRTGTDLCTYRYKNIYKSCKKQLW